MRVPSGRRVRNRTTESVNVPRWSSDPTGAEELAADRLFVALRAIMVHATDNDESIPHWTRNRGKPKMILH